ncbi:DUF4359 domain-containing protein [Salisaeta longa]|uniref:DUF4359 domain-containing protein n=1 Tax=Salisaeta longa TaxID=503170 RepID=UPI0003FCC2E2|nr:DUF4359 domain-containing protein [Salisaeta longa]
MRSLTLVVLGIVLGILIWSNPTMQAFQQSFGERITQQIQGTQDDGWLERQAARLGGALAAENIDRFTTRRSYLIASTYTVDLDGDKTPELRALGIFGRFFTLDEQS